MTIRQFKKACKIKFAYKYRTPKVEHLIRINPDKKCYLCGKIEFDFINKKIIKL